MHTKLAFVIPTFVGILLASVLACSNAEPDPMLARAQVELDSQRTLWEQTRSSEYTYEYNVLCECWDNFGQTVKVTVTNGAIESVVYAESGVSGKEGEATRCGRGSRTRLPHHRQLVRRDSGRHRRRGRPAYRELQQ